jgi:hypothetical protein
MGIAVTRPEHIMRPVSSEKAAEDEAQASPVRASWSSSEILVVAAGGLAMLLVVGLFDALKLLP